MPSDSPSKPSAVVQSHRAFRFVAGLRMVFALARRGRWARSLVSLAAVVTAFCLYWVLVVPWIEPQVDFRMAEADSAFDAMDDDTLLTGSSRKELVAWFPEGAWERGQTITLESARARLLLKRYRNRQDGTVEIEPCTIVFLPQEPGEDDLWIRKAVVLQAPQGAILRFDKPIDLRRGRIGNLVGGTLLGPITIRSDGEQPGPADDLWVEAREAKLTPHAIISSHPVRFRLGQHQGSGNGLHIELIAGGEKNTHIDGLRWLQLDRDVRMRLDMADLERRRAEENTFGKASSPLADVTKQPEEAETIAIRSAGPFRFDFEQTVATFRRQVEVVRYQGGRPNDTLKGETVAIYFAASNESVGEHATTTSSQRLSGLEPQRLEARGTPVVLRSPSSAVEAVGQVMRYDLRTGEGTLEGRRGVLLRRGDSEIRAPLLRFQPGNDGTWGKFSATGPGSLDGRLPDDPNVRISARWQKSIRFAPHEGVPLLSLEGDAEFAMSGRGRLAGESIYIWLREAPSRETVARGAEVPAPQPAANAQTTPSNGFFSSGGRRLEPDRMLAQGRVRFELAQLTGRVDELQAWFEPQMAGNGPPMQRKQPLRQEGGNAQHRTQGADVVAMASDMRASRTISALRQQNRRTLRAQPRAETGVRSQTNRSVLVQTVAFSTETHADRPSTMVAGPTRLNPDPNTQRPRFHVEAATLQVEMRQGPTSLVLSALVLRHNVQITELWTDQSNEQPLRLRGELVEMQGRRGASQNTDHIVVLEGTPASVSARTMAIEGPRIELDRANSRLLVQGAGRMTLPMDRDLQGQPLSTPEPLQVAWQRGMRFNGRTAWFERHVQCRLGHHTLQTDAMRVDFLTPIDFNRPPGGQRPEIRQFTCNGPFTIRGRTFDQDRLMAWQELRARDLTIHRPSGKIAAQGPGTLRLVRRGSPEGSNVFSLPGGPTTSRATQRPSTTDSAELSYLGLEFHRGLSGNLNHRRLTFYDRVVAVFGPVNDWQERIDPEVFDSPNPPGMLMHCERFEVVQIESSIGIHTEFEAVGNTTVESGAFYARAAKMRYAEVKDQIVLEGNGRAKAELWRQLRPGAPQSGTTARKILYWRTTGHVEVDDAEQLDLNLLSSQPSERR